MSLRSGSQYAKSLRLPQTGETSARNRHSGVMVKGQTHGRTEPVGREKGGKMSLKSYAIREKIAGIWQPPRQ